MQTTEFLFKALYLLLHNSFTVCELVFNFFVYMWNICVNYYYYIWVISNEEEYILKNVKNITKLPRHLTILLGEESPSLKDLANLVVWSIASGICYISFYDYEGILKEYEEKFKKAVNNIKCPGDHVIWHQGEHSYSNGFCGRKIHIRIFSLSDSHETVAEVTKQLATVKDIEISQETVDMHLRKKYVFPDPDLGLYCGKVFQLFGYPPWQICTTEFLSLHSHHNVNLHTFIKLLYRYNKTEQRLGK